MIPKKRAQRPCCTRERALWIEQMEAPDGVELPRGCYSDALDAERRFNNAQCSVTPNSSCAQKHVALCIKSARAGCAAYSVPCDCPLTGTVLHVDRDERRLFVRPAIFERLYSTVSASLDRVVPITLVRAPRHHVDIDRVLLCFSKQSKTFVRAVLGRLVINWGKTIRYQMYFVDEGRMEIVDEQEVFVLPEAFASCSPLCLPLMLANCSRSRPFCRADHFASLHPGSICVFSILSSNPAAEGPKGRVRALYPPAFASRIFRGYSTREEILCLKQIVHPVMGLWEFIEENRPLSCIARVSRRKVGDAPNDLGLYRAVASNFNANGLCSVFLIDYGETLACDVYSLFICYGQPREVVESSASSFRCVVYDRQNNFAKLAEDDCFSLVLNTVDGKNLFVAKLADLKVDQPEGAVNGAFGDVAEGLRRCSGSRDLLKNLESIWKGRDEVVSEELRLHRTICYQNAMALSNFDTRLRTLETSVNSKFSELTHRLDDLANRTQRQTTARHDAESNLLRKPRSTARRCLNFPPTLPPPSTSPFYRSPMCDRSSSSVDVGRHFLVEVERPRASTGFSVPPPFVPSEWLKSAAWASFGGRLPKQKSNLAESESSLLGTELATSTNRVSVVLHDDVSAPPSVPESLNHVLELPTELNHHVEKCWMCGRRPSFGVFCALKPTDAEMVFLEKLRKAIGFSDAKQVPSTDIRVFDPVCSSSAEISSSLAAPVVEQFKYQGYFYHTPIEMDIEYTVKRSEGDVDLLRWPLFFVQIESEEIADLRSTYLDCLFADIPLSENDLKMGRLCIAHSGIRDEKCRAVVSSLGLDSVEVFLIDFGSFEWLPICDLYSIEDQVYRTRTLPGLAIPCVLAPLNRSFLEANPGDDQAEMAQRRDDIAERVDDFRVRFLAERCDSVCVVEICETNVER